MHSFNRLLSDTKFIFSINLVVLISSMVLLRLPIALGYRSNLLYRALGLVPIIIALFISVLYILKNNVNRKVDKKALLLLSLFIGIWAQSIIRSALHEINFNTFYFSELLLSILILGLFVTVAFCANQDINRQTLLQKGMIYAFGLYIILNLIFYIIGVDSHDPFYLAKYPTQMLNFLGIKSYRVLFPMADGINNFGSVAGATLIGHLHLLKSQCERWEKRIILFVILSCLVVILLTDSRGALLFSVLSIILISLPDKLFRFIRWSPFIISVLPLLIVVTTPRLVSESTSWLNRSLSEWNGEIIASFEETCQETLENSSGALSNRPIIWKIIVDELKNIKLIHLMGYGMRGQTVSNISARYACLFASYSYNLNASSHNIWLQAILDIGYIGLFVTILLLVYLILKLARLVYFGQYVGYKGLLNILLYTILIGSLEAPLSPDFYGLFTLIIFISISSLFVIPTDSEQS